MEPISPVHIYLYQSNTGEIPYQSWFFQLKDTKTKAIVAKRLERIANGNFGDCKHIDDNLFEIRIDYGPGYRVYFAKIENTVVLLLVGGDKSSQNNDIKKAKAYYQDHKQHGEPQ